MKLDFLTFEYAGVTHPYTGGIGNWIANLAPALANHGHEVTVLTTDPNNSGVVVTPDGVVVYREQESTTRSAAIDIARGITWPRFVERWLLARPDTDLVIAPEWGGMAARFAASSSRTRLITQLHGSGEQFSAYSMSRTLRPGSAISRWRKLHRERSQAARSDAVLGCSGAVLDDTLRRWELCPSFTAVMPNILDLERVRQLAQGLPPPLPPGRYVLFFGRLEPRKGVHILAEAMKEVLAVHSDVYLVIAGADAGWRGGSMMEHVRRILGEVAHRIVYLGQLPPDRLMPLIAASDVVALPSVFEPFGFVVLETIALGRPLVSTSGHGVDDIVTDGVEALLVPPSSAQALEEAIERLLVDRDLGSRLGEQAALRAERYGHRPGAALATEIFAEVIAQTPKPNNRYS